MNDEPVSRNKEFEVHRHMLEFEHKWTRRRGLALIMLGTGLASVGTVMVLVFFNTFHVPSLQDGSLWLIFALLVLSTVVFPISLIPSGLKTLQKGEQPITDTEVEARRQAERSQLFAQARGNLPEAYTPHGRRFALIAGGGIATFSVTFLILVWGQPTPLSGPGRIVGIGCALFGLVVMAQPLVYNRKAADALQQRSTQALRQRLADEEHPDTEDEE